MVPGWLNGALAYLTGFWHLDPAGVLADSSAHGAAFDPATVDAAAARQRHDRGGRGGHSSRRPTLFHEEVRAHGRGKVLVPIHDFVQKLIAARLAADVQGVPTLFIGRTDALSATLMRGDIDRVDQEHLSGERTADGFWVVKNGLEYAVARAHEFAPYVDLIWCETSTPDMDEAREFAKAIHASHPGKLLAYNCSASFNWKRKLNDQQIAAFQEELGDMGYKFQFITLAGFHTLNASMYDLAWNYARAGMTAFVNVQEHEFKMEREMGFRAVKHQSFVGAGYFDQVQMAVTGGDVSTSAMKGSTEEQQFSVSH